MGAGWGCTVRPKRIAIVIDFHTSYALKAHLEDPSKTYKLRVVDFSASSSEPCRQMEPILNSLAWKYSDVEFIKIDIDELNDVAREFGVEATPTFVLMRSGEELGRVVGAEGVELENLIQKHRG